jgi:hypothetical protein
VTKRHAVIARALCAALAVWGCRAQAHADAFHFQGIPLGQRALGLGGAFTGIADDPSAAYYNPAGLVWGADAAMSGSFTVNAFDRQKITRGYRTPLGESTLVHASDPSLPVSVGLSKQLGHRNELGERRHAIAISTFTVDERRLSFDRQVLDTGPSGIATLSVDRSTATHWQGLSYAYRASTALSFGFSGFLSLTRTSYRDELIAAELGPVDMTSGAYASDAGSWTSHRTSTNVKNIVMRAGVLFQYNSRLRLGLMLQPPSIHVRGTASVRERALDLAMASGEGGRFFNVEQGGLAARYPIPWEIRGGASYRVREWLTLSLDASVYGRDGSTKKPVVFIGPRSPNRQTGGVAGVGEFELERSHRLMSGNVALGAEARVGKMAAIRAGVFTSLSSAPPIPSLSSVYMAPDVNRVGMAMSVGIEIPGFDCSLGTAGLFGRGDALALDTSPDSEAPYHRTRVRDATLFVFITGMRSAVNKLMKTAEERQRDFRAAPTR